MNKEVIINELNEKIKLLTSVGEKSLNKQENDKYIIYYDYELRKWLIDTERPLRSIKVGSTIKIGVNELIVSHTLSQLIEVIDHLIPLQFFRHANKSLIYHAPYYST